MFLEINNAIDSMKGKGVINITVEKSKDIVKINIQDTGKGIHSKDFNRIFKPGYTSKKRGWGLGLSLSKRIIQDYHKGKIILKKSQSVFVPEKRKHKIMNKSSEPLVILETQLGKILSEDDIIRYDVDYIK